MAAEIGYCVKCRAKREMKDAKEVEMKGGRRAMKGICVKCKKKFHFDKGGLLTNAIIRHFVAHFVFAVGSCFARSRSDWGWNYHRFSYRSGSG